MIKIIIVASLIIFSNFANANSYGLYNSKDRTYEVQKNIDEIKSIASITKLFTAYTIINSNVDLFERILVKGKSSGYFANGSRVERYELLRAMLMSSDNRSAESLANAHPGGIAQFLIDVNLHIVNLGLKDTVIVDPTGKMSGNVSTIEQLTKFLIILKEYPLIKYLSSTHQHLAEYIPPKNKRPVKIQLRNTNQFVFTHDEIILTKTGFTSAAGRCLAMLIEKNGVVYSLITLGNNNVKQRTSVISRLLAYNNK